jgi:tetratricopeptide (TPR) repeat protein
MSFPPSVQEPQLRNQSDTIRDRFSCDYSRWSDSTFKPDDPASIEENERIQKLKEEDNLAKFESANKEFCAKFNEDIKRRQTKDEERSITAAKHRLQGNRLFKCKHYDRALRYYKKALKEDPYAVNILTNIALTYSKLQQWEDCLEFSSRALHLDKTCSKALCQSAKAYFELGQIDKVYLTMQLALQLNPKNVELIAYNDSLQDEIKERKAKESIAKIMTYKKKKGCPKLVNQYWKELSRLSATEDIGDDWLDADFLAVVDDVIDALTHSRFSNFQEHQYHLVICFIYKSSILQAYIRNSGHLNSLCKYICLDDKNPKLCYDEKMKTVIIFGFLAACIFQEPRSLSIVGEVSCLYFLALRFLFYAI